jgi:muramoyltetrapeptide carboxypeptidase
LYYQFSANTDNFKLNRSGACSAPIIGGNLSLLYALNGSKSDTNMDGKILFIEDLDEYLYHIDRMMLSLKRCGKLSKLKGLVVGGMSDMKDNAIPFGKTAAQIISETVAEYHYPVCFDFPCGHIHDNRSILLGADALLEVDEGKASLRFF